MDASQLAGDMLQWEIRKRELDVLEAEIKAAVLEIGKTQTVGNIRASYSAGRKKYDYRGAFFDKLEELGRGGYDKMEAQLDDIHDKHVKEVADFRAICKDAKLDVPFTQGEPSVSVKLI